MVAEKTWIILLFLCFEKVVQHLFVTYAFFKNISSIRSDMAFDYRYFMYVGLIIALLFAVAFYGLLKQEIWGHKLAFTMGWVDFFGEFVGQGGALNFIPLSFIVAIIIIILSYRYNKSIQDSNQVV